MKSKQERKYEAWKAYRGINDPARREYEEIRDSAWKVYEDKLEEIEKEI